MIQQGIEQDYALLDSGYGRKLERFGPFLIVRPAAQAVWHPQLEEGIWKKADAVFKREPSNQWIKQKHLPNNWLIKVEGITFKIEPTEFGHLGIFPEQRELWKQIQQMLKQETRKEPVKVLNLFAYSGGATMAAALEGAHVCHLDASKGMVAWARENALLNRLEHTAVRWIVDDVSKFLQRELRRQNRYDAIILDPPTFGRGSQGEVFKIEEDLLSILKSCRDLLSSHPLFVLFSCHTPGFTPIVMDHLMAQMTQSLGGRKEVGEMVLRGDPDVFSLPSGSYALWHKE